MQLGVEFFFPVIISRDFHADSEHVDTRLPIFHHYPAKLQVTTSSSQLRQNVSPEIIEAQIFHVNHAF